MVDNILCDIDMDDDIDDAENDSIKLSNVLLDKRCDLLYDIHAHLIYNDRNKWSKVNMDDIYPNMLMHGEEMMKKCTVAEIKTICGVMEHYTKRSWFSTGSLKAVNVNSIVWAFGGSNTVQEESIRKSTATQYFEPEISFFSSRLHEESNLRKNVPDCSLRNSSYSARSSEMVMLIPVNTRR